MEYTTKKVIVSELKIDEKSKKIKAASILAIVQVVVMIAMAALYFVLSNKFELHRTDYNITLLVLSCIIACWLLFGFAFLFSAKLRSKASYIIFNSVGLAIFVALSIYELANGGLAFENMTMLIYFLISISLLLTLLYVVGLFKKFKGIKITLIIIFVLLILFAAVFVFTRFYPWFNISYYSFIESVSIVLFLTPLMLMLLYKPTHFEKVEKEIQIKVKEPKTENTSLEKRNSYFDGKLLQLIGWRLLGNIICLFTLYICLPWAKCMVYGWEARHTVIENKRLEFDGKAIELFGKWMLWWFLSIITLGIYALWIPIRLQAWKTKHTYFAAEKE